MNRREDVMKNSQKEENERVVDDAYLYAEPDCSGQTLGILVGGVLVTALILCMYFNII